MFFQVQRACFGTLFSHHILFLFWPFTIPFSTLHLPVTYLLYYFARLFRLQEKGGGDLKRFFVCNLKKTFKNSTNVGYVDSSNAL